MGDLNAQIGKEKHIERIVGKYTVHSKTNDNGQKLCTLAAKNNMIISSTKFNHPRKHKVTWIAPDQKKQSQIDHILINKRRQSSIMDVRSYRGPCADTDHYMVGAKLKLKTKTNVKAKQSIDKWNIQKLKSEEIREKYRDKTHIMTEELNNEVKSIEERWLKLKKIIVEAASETIGKATNTKKKEWMNEECWKVIKQKVEARLRYISANEEEYKKEYERLRKESKQIIKRCKRRWINSEIEEIEKNNRNGNTKQFYQKIKQQNREHKPKLRGIKNKMNGRIEESEQEIKGVWVRHFKEPLNDER